MFDIPVYWPILLIYFFILFALTMRRQIQCVASLSPLSPPALHLSLTSIPPHLLLLLLVSPS